MCKRCFLCDRLLSTLNVSKEHIIKNSIGGRKKVADFICIQCNSDTGSDWDSEVDQLFGADISLLLGIKRERGSPPKKQISDFNTGENFIFTGGKIIKNDPSYLYDKNTGTIRISAPTKKRAEQYLNQLKSEGKVPNDTSQTTDNTIKENIHINTKFKFRIPELNSNFSKSIVKSALALLSKDHTALTSCTRAKKFLVKDGTPCLDYLYHYDPIDNRYFASPIHCVHVFSEDDRIHAYVELFGIARYCMCLSDSYTGNVINFTYAINPLYGSEIDIRLSFDKIPEGSKHPGGLMQSLLEEIDFDKKVNIAFKQSVTEALDVIKSESKNIDFSIFSDTLTQKFLKIVNPELKGRTSKAFYNHAVTIFEDLNVKLAESISNKI